jgi:sphinganine-1-phosphate aldolase
MKTYRDHALATRGITEPEMIVPISAHAAFDKAAQYFGIEIIHVPTGPDWRADVAATEAAITDNTIVIVGSAPSFPHGVIDPIEELSELARSRGIGFHTDGCLGGFVLPWAEKLGYPVPLFDFRLPGVTSISADTHKYGYAAKGTSVVLYRNLELRHHQYFTITDWPGGLYASPTFAGSRAGALSAACWAALVSIGEAGYLDATARILTVADEVKAGLSDGFPELEILGDSLFVVAFASADETLDVYRVLDAMSSRGWSLNGLHRPAAVHLCVTQRHTKPGFTQHLLADLRASIDEVRLNPTAEGGMAPIYGMANTIPERGLVADAMLDHMDEWYRLP